MKLLNAPMFSNIYCFDYGSLFAGKIHALLMRNWRERIKGRDYFDYMFYISHDVKFNLDYLRNKLEYSLNKDTSNYTIDDIKSLLKSLDCDKLQKFFNAVFTNDVFIILPP